MANTRGPSLLESQKELILLISPATAFFSPLNPSSKIPYAPSFLIANQVEHCHKSSILDSSTSNHSLKEDEEELCC